MKIIIPKTLNINRIAKTLKRIYRGKVIRKVVYAITVLNKNGAANAFFRYPYDKYVKISNIKAQLYDESGEEIKKKGGFDIQDYAISQDYSTYSDMRMKVIDHEQLKFPFTIEYNYEITFSDRIGYPDWNPVSDYNVAVEKSSYRLIVPKPSNIRLYKLNIKDKPEVVENNESIIYNWKLINEPAWIEENFSPGLNEVTSVVKIAPTKVNVEGFEGRFDSWKEFGLWINSLIKGKDNLPIETSEKVKQLIAGVEKDREKIKILYEYMQNKTRYVSIQVGLGGNQPFDAATVDRLSYGDCKALSNYMKSLLKAAGIRSLYTEVFASEENPPFYVDFPSYQFNHIILCVPLENDTVWLECTSQRNPFNFLGPSTANRQVLLIDNDGGTLVHTPMLRDEKNLESRRTKVTLDDSGSGTVKVQTTYSGYAYRGYLPIYYSDQTDRKKMITRRIHIPNFELNSFSINENRAELPSISEQLDLSVSSYGTLLGDKIMLSLNIMNKLEETPFQSDERKTAVVFEWPVYETDTVEYILPAGYTLERVPASVTLSSAVGRYSTDVIRTGSTLQYVRKFSIYQARYPVERYEEIVDFFDKIVKADDLKVILTRL